MDKELVARRKKLCSGTFFAKVIGYAHSWVCIAENGRRNVSDRFIRDYEEGLKKVEEMLKK